MELTVRLRKPHPKQVAFIGSSAPRKIIRAGRRSGKTSGVAILAVQSFLAGKRVLYATPTDEQIDRFWFEVKRALAAPLEQAIYYKNETRHIIEMPGTEQRIRAKTAWDADTLRGDYADLLILDEYQRIKPEAWELVGAPMLLDNNGDAVFIYTPMRGAVHTKALYAKAQDDKTGRWAVFNFTSHDNPYLSRTALSEITKDMTRQAYLAEIEAQDYEDNPAALWRRGWLEAGRVTAHPALTRIVVGVDPPGTEEGAECGIVVAGVAQVGGKWHGYVLSDSSLHGSPAKWGSESVAAYNRHEANLLVGEVNNGGDMVEHTIRTVDGGDKVAFKAVRASRGKLTRAEPIAAQYEQGRIHHVGTFGELEDQYCLWAPGDTSPDRLDAAVWALTELTENWGDTGPLLLWGRTEGEDTEDIDWARRAWQKR